MFTLIISSDSEWSLITAQEHYTAPGGCNAEIGDYILKEKSGRSGAVRREGAAQ